MESKHDKHAAEDGMREQQLAQKVADAMMAGDSTSRALGMTVVEAGPGSATLRMTVRREMLNPYKTCHGGNIFTLADSAFGFAANSRNFISVASGCSIEFLAPAHDGDVLTAQATEVAQQGKIGVYDVAVKNQHGVTIAAFRGRSHRLPGHIVENS